MILLRTLIFTVFIPGTVTVLVPYLLLTSRNAPPPVPLGPLRYAGAIPVLLGASFYFWCAWDFTFAGRGTPAPFDPPRELVVRGLYRYVRNPMYVGIVSLLVGEALLFQSRWLMEYAVTAFIFYHLLVILYEEPTLKRKFGDSYKRYSESVPRWIPRGQNRLR